MQKIVAKYFGFLIQDLTKQTSILSTLKLLRKSQFWDEEKMYDYRLEKLKNLIDYASINVPYYETLFNAIKLTSRDIKSLDDIQKIPVLTKEIVRNENMRLVSKKANMKYVKKGKSGGTTGAPIVIYKDTISRSFTWASYYRWYEWMGLNYFDKTATLWGANTVLSSSAKAKLLQKLTRYIQNNIFIDSFKMNQQTLPVIYNKINEFQPLLLKGYLSSLLTLAEFVETNNLQLPKLKALASTTETLLPPNRKYLERIFNAPIYDQYGCGEVSAISYECSKHNGLHINQEHVIVEILSENDSPIVEQRGRVIATDLDNYAMPFIRYDTDDIASFSQKKCSCGINQPLMNSVEGRAADTIILKDGYKVHGVFFTDVLYELNILTNKIQRFQVQQTAPGEISFLIEKGTALEQKDLTQLNNALMRYFNKVKIEIKNYLKPEPNGKFLYIKSIRDSNPT